MLMEKILLILFIIHVLGSSVFGRFEAETTWWRLVLKWFIAAAISYGILSVYGQTTAITFIALLSAAGVTFHFIWCSRNAIHPLKATPRKRYHALRGWKWQE